MFTTLNLAAKFLHNDIETASPAFPARPNYPLLPHLPFKLHYGNNLCAFGSRDIHSTRRTVRWGGCIRIAFFHVFTFGIKYSSLNKVLLSLSLLAKTLRKFSSTPSRGVSVHRAVYEGTASIFEPATRPLADGGMLFPRKPRRSAVSA